MSTVTQKGFNVFPPVTPMFEYCGTKLHRTISTVDTSYPSIGSGINCTNCKWVKVDVIWTTPSNTQSITLKPIIISEHVINDAAVQGYEDVLLAGNATGLSYVAGGVQSIAGVTTIGAQGFLAPVFGNPDVYFICTALSGGPCKVYVTPIKGDVVDNPMGNGVGNNISDVVAKLALPTVAFAYANTATATPTTLTFATISSNVVTTSSTVFVKNTDSANNLNVSFDGGTSFVALTYGSSISDKIARTSVIVKADTGLTATYQLIVQ